MRIIGAMLIGALAGGAALAQAVPDYGPDLERYDYPAPVQWFESASDVGPLRMAFLDYAPRRANGRTVVLLHGKNFCAATWHATALALAAAGYRVIAPDQVGFCKSSKPESFQYSFHALGDLTFRLLESRGIGKATIIAHSMGGQLGTRMALMQPDRVEQLVLVGPLGLSDRLAEGGGYTPLARLQETERRTTFDSIKRYQLAAYYHGEWRPEYDEWVRMRAGMYQGQGRDRMAIAQARTSDILQTQPVVYELDRLKVPTTLMIGMLDATGADLSGPPRAVRAAPGSIPFHAENAVKRIPGGRLVRMEGLGHSPQVEDPITFRAALFKVLAER